MNSIKPEDWTHVRDIAPDRRFVCVNSCFESLLTGVQSIDVLRDGTATLLYEDGTKQTKVIAQTEPLIMCGLIEAIQA